MLLVRGLNDCVIEKNVDSYEIILYKNCKINRHNDMENSVICNLMSFYECL